MPPSTGGEACCAVDGRLAATSAHVEPCSLSCSVLVRRRLDWLASLPASLPSSKSILPRTEAVAVDVTLPDSLPASFVALRAPARRFDGGGGGICFADGGDGFPFALC